MWVLILAGEFWRHCRRADRKDANREDDIKDGLVTVLKTSERKFRPLMNQSTGRDIGIIRLPVHYASTPLSVALMNRLLWVAPLLRLDVLGKWFIREDVRGSDFPADEEILPD